MNSLKKKIECPYCGYRFNIPGPANQSCEPHEVECVPYTRDVGRFDPEGEADWFDPEKWTRIGKDYLPLMNWEKFGILRVTTPNINVQYRVQGCPHCYSLFDVYANYTVGVPFETLWPHLFARNANDRQSIRLYYGESWPIWTIRKIGKAFRSVFMGGVIFGLLVFSIWFFPQWVATSFQMDSMQIILHAVAALTIATLLIVGERYVSYVEKTRDFDHLFSIKKTKFGLVHWRNYILSRFVGVQNDKFPNLSQVDIISGGFSILIMIAAWASGATVGASGLIWLAVVLLVLLLAFFVAGKLNKRYKASAAPILLKITLWLVSLLLMVGAAFVLGIDQKIGLSLSQLFFWVIFAYFVGISGLLSLNTSFYILDGLTRIPMSLTPYNNFQQVKPLRVLESFSVALLLILFVSFLAVTYVSTFLQIDWLIDWFRLILVFLFVASGFALKRGEYFGIAALYFLISFLPKLNLVVFAIPLDPRLITLGLVFTIIVGFQITKTDGTIARLLGIAKDKELSNIDEQMKTISDQITEIDKKLSLSSNTERESKDLQAQRKSALESIEVLLRLRDRVDKVSVRPFVWRRTSELLVPLLSSLFLPSFTDVVTFFMKTAFGIQ